MFLHNCRNGPRLFSSRPRENFDKLINSEGHLISFAGTAEGEEGAHSPLGQMEEAPTWIGWQTDNEQTAWLSRTAAPQSPPLTAAGGQHETLTVGLEAAGTGMVAVGLGDKGQNKNKCRQKIRQALVAH